MILHRTTGSWKLGLTLALVPTLLWGLLPVVLKGLLVAMDPWTITWYRVLIAAVVLGAVVLPKYGLAPLKALSPSGVLLLLLCGVGLCANYITYVVGLEYITPGTAQVVIQLAPMLLLLGSLFVFRERFTAFQWSGTLVFIAGLLVFFNRRLGDLLDAVSEYTLGVFFIVIASLTWAVYALAQKQLLRSLPSSYIMLFVYLAGTVAFLPFAKPEAILTLDAVHLGLLAFGGLNTLVAYGCFAEALDHWEASRIGAVLTVIPLVTVAAVEIGAVWFPGYVEHEVLTWLSLLVCRPIIKLKY